MSGRPVATDALATLGTIIDATQKRDAIHLAVIPMQSKMRGTTLPPGAFLDAGGDLCSEAGAVGIIDPFLTEPVRPGEWFWLVIKPRVITSLRHVWAHPAFPDEAQATGPTDIARSPSETWMRAWAMKHMTEGYYGGSVQLLADEAYHAAVRAGHVLHLGTHENAREAITDEWWDHWEAITGTPGERGSYFSCSC